MMPNGTKWATWRDWFRLCWRVYRQGWLVSHVKSDGYERITIDLSRRFAI